jgi:hypothetical protein
VALKNAYCTLEIKIFEGTEQLFNDLKNSHIKVV